MIEIASAPLRERHAGYAASVDSTTLHEEELTALWLLGRVPAALLAPWTLLRAGRAGRGPGPDVREIACTLPSGGLARTIAVGPLLGHDPERLRALLRRGPATSEPCADASKALGAERVHELLRSAGQQRMAERSWRAARLVTEHGWGEAWSLLLERALRGSAGRTREDGRTRANLAARIDAALGTEPLHTLALLAREERPGALIEALRGDLVAPVIGGGRAAEVGWNAVLPLLAALATAYQDVPLARSVARLIATWPAPRPYGRTRALASLLLGDGATTAGALRAQGLLHTQELWCERGGCGLCPFTAASGPLLPDDSRTSDSDRTHPVILNPEVEA